MENRIGATVERLAHHLLGRHVVRGPDQDPFLREVGRGILGEAEVGDLDAAVSKQHQVGRLDVPMHHVVVVRVIERLAGLGDQLHDLADGQQLPGPGVRLERLPLDVLHRDEELALVLADVEDGDHTGVLEPAGRLRFAGEPLAHLVRLGRREVLERVDGLDRDAAIDHRVVGEVDPAHRPPSDLLDDLVAAYGLRNAHLGLFSGMPRRMREKTRCGSSCRPGEC